MIFGTIQKTTLKSPVRFNETCLYGIQDIGNGWIISYVTGRVTFTNNGGGRSSVLPFERYVSQVWIVVPFLFLIAIYYLAESSQFLKFCTYAVAPSLHCTSKTIVKINRWFVANKLFINYIKTKYMVFHRSNKLVSTVLPPIYIYNVSISKVHLLKLLVT